MGLFDRIFGGGSDRAARPAPPIPQAPHSAPMPGSATAPNRPLSDDELAIERYRYLLRTAPPESIEAVHAEAFARLTPEQRRQVVQALAESAPAGERPASDDPATLARAATRAELRSPGTMERAFAGGPGGRGPSFGSMLGASMLGTIAGYVVGSAIAQSFLPDPGVDQAAADDAGAADAGAADSGAEDAGTADAGGDWGGDFGGGGDWGGDFGGGDFGF